MRLGWLTMRLREKPRQGRCSHTKKNASKNNTKMRGTLDKSAPKEKKLSVESVKIKGIMRKHADTDLQLQHQGTMLKQKGLDPPQRTGEVETGVEAEVVAEGKARGGRRGKGLRLPQECTQPGLALSALPDIPTLM